MAMGPPVGLHDEVAAAEPGPAHGGVLLDLADEQAVAVGQPDRAPQLAGGPARHQPHAQVEAGRRLAPGKALDPGPEVVVGGDRQVEALAQAVGVQADQAAVAVDDRRPRRTRSSGAVCSTLPVMRRPQGPRKAWPTTRPARA